MTETATTGKKAPRAAKPRVPKPAADAARLKALAARIEEMKDTRLPELIAELIGEGMTLTSPGDATKVKLAGITAESRAGRHMALTNWAMAARRQVLQLENA